MNDPLILKVLLEDNPDGSYSIGQVVDAIGEYYVVRYELSDRAPPLTAANELATAMPRSSWQWVEKITFSERSTASSRKRKS